jgi:hypothetical protein
MVERKSLVLDQFRPEKQMILVLLSSFWWGEFIQGVPPLNLHEMVYLNPKRILVLG